MKNRKDLPFVMKMPLTIPLDYLKKGVDEALTLNDNIRLKYDTESSYIIDNGKGNNFVYTNEGVNLYPTKNKPSDYNIATLHKLNSRAEEWLSTHTNAPSLSPLERLKGMKDPYNNKFWHPTFDEREYDVRTPLCNPILGEFLDSFNEPTCRAAVTRFFPGMFLSPHVDIGPEYVVRTQTPIVTNSKSVMGFRKHKNDKWELYNFEPGFIYFVNTGWEHFARNDGDNVRIQIRVLTKTQNILNQMEEVKSTWFVDNWEIIT